MNGFSGDGGFCCAFDIPFLSIFVLTSQRHPPVRHGNPFQRPKFRHSHGNTKSGDVASEQWTRIGESFADANRDEKDVGDNFRPRVDDDARRCL